MMQFFSFCYYDSFQKLILAGLRPERLPARSCGTLKDERVYNVDVPVLLLKYSIHRMAQKVVHLSTHQVK